MNWIVTWVVVNFFIVACPQAGPAVNQYGVMEDHGLVVTTMQLCYDSEETQQHRYFGNKEDAKEFIFGLAVACDSDPLCEIKDIVLDYSDGLE